MGCRPLLVVVVVVAANRLFVVNTKLSVVRADMDKKLKAEFQEENFKRRAAWE